MKYDEFGFIKFEWALEHMEGFDELDPCCQNLITLFPGQPHACAIAEEAIGPMPVTSTLPAGLLDTPSGGYGGGAAAGALLAGALLPRGGGSSYTPNPQSVPEPAMLPMLLLGVAVILWIRRHSAKRNRI